MHEVVVSSREAQRMKQDISSVMYETPRPSILKCDARFRVAKSTRSDAFVCARRRGSCTQMFSATERFRMNKRIWLSRCWIFLQTEPSLWVEEISQKNSVLWFCGRLHLAERNCLSRMAAQERNSCTISSAGAEKPFDLRELRAKRRNSSQLATGNASYELILCRAAC